MVVGDDNIYTEGVSELYLSNRGDAAVNGN